MRPTHLGYGIGATAYRPSHLGGGSERMGSEYRPRYLFFLGAHGYSGCRRVLSSGCVQARAVLASASGRYPRKVTGASMPRRWLRHCHRPISLRPIGRLC